MANDNLVLICGASATGKSASLMGLENPPGVMYLNTEANKKLPFPSKFQEFNITDPLQVNEAFDHAETKPEIHTVVVDSQTFLMDQFESTYVLGSSDTMKGWSNYAQYFKTLMQQNVAGSTKNVYFTAHTVTTYNEADMVMETKVPVKGALKNNGIEAYFSVVIACKRKTIKELEPYKNSLLNISEDEMEDGFKYVFQTRLTKDTVNERIRAPLKMFSRQVHAPLAKTSGIVFDYNWTYQFTT